MMSENEVLARLQGVFDRVFVEPPSLQMELTAKQVSEWDSLKHVELLMAVEKEFRLSFSVGEMMNFQKVGDLVKLLAARIGASG
jgi:acyl carrier protein